MVEQTSFETMDTKQLMQGWGISALLHLGLVITVLMVAPKFMQMNEPESFKWNVALVEQSHDGARSETSLTQSGSAVETPREPIMARVRPKQPMQALQPVLDQPQLIERQDTKREEVKEPDPVAREIAEAPSPVASVQTSVAPAGSQSVAEQPSEPVSDAQATPVVEPSPVSPGQAPAVTVSTKADYRWVGDSLYRRVKELQKYPTAGRLNGWEGKVVVKAVIRADGQLAALSVHKSSGYEALDLDALETIRLACPLQMKQPIAVPEMAFYVPVKYSLNN